MEMFKWFLQSRIAEGSQFNVGQTIQCSWMWFMVGADEKGEMSILAPQLGVMPMRFVTDCSDALNLVATQRHVCDSFGVECDPCTACQTAIVVKGLADCRRVFMNQTDREKGKASGWFWGAPDSRLDVNKADSLQLKSLWQLACEIPQSRDFFLLPQGWQVVFENCPVVLRDFNTAIPKPSSYYAAKYSS